ncbi:NmrA family NAD(P)-binding protein [Mucilaginibacter dorajii]|uniref:NmrA family NAD(P)-binding protein n=1 Tax=Mucilaginibacter dorajii TaxID=692994 RepID=A0ABP7P8F7_9SPHI|nr:NmrA family NAD(P)-binding protein [Mucilaginibacter dorajii]MCS3735304.1 uncharacterized protein YbjT (DUF2867 family) [Mucilaginibacter dorajii]
MKIIVTGSLGNIGKPLAAELIAKGHNVTVISSNREKQKDIEALGVTAAIGSLEDVDFLTATFAGADALFAMEPPNHTAPDTRAAYRTIGKNYARVIPQSGIKRVVHLSSYGAHLDKGTGFILGVHDVEGILNKLQGVAITHLRPAFFYYNLYNFVNMIKQAGFIGTNYGGDDKLAMVAPSDIAAAAAEELVTPTVTTGNNVRYVASDDVTGHEAARILGEAIGKPDLKWVVFTDEQTQAAMEQNGVPANIAAQYVELGAAIHNGTLRGDYDLHKPAVMGKVKLVDFAKEFAVEFER